MQKGFSRYKTLYKTFSEKPVRSTCGLCQIGCGILIHVVGGRVTKIEGDLEHPLNRGKLCVKGKRAMDYLYHPQRLRAPLKKSKNGNWNPITWREAINEIAEGMNRIKKKYGAKSVVFMRGAAKGLQDDYLSRFANAFGSPNITSMGHVCFIPRKVASDITYGYYAIGDLEHPPGCIIVWANNVSETLHHVYERIKEAKKKGSFLIVIDPLRTDVAKLADIWVKIRPGTDLALALGIIYVIVDESLYDAEFIDKYTIGFEELQKEIRRYDLDIIEKITDVSSGLIKEVARVYAKKRPSVIQWGNGIDHTVHNFQTARAICILRAISGNLGVPGGDMYFSPPAIKKRGIPELTLQDLVPLEEREKRIGGAGFMLPSIFYALPQLVIDAILKGDPYEVKCVYIQGGNFLLTYPNARKVYEALKKVELLIVSDHFMTPTAHLAHYVLPAATFFEFDSLVLPPYSLPVLSIQQKVVQTSSVKSDYEILRDLSKPLGFGDLFWEEEKECLDNILSPLGITFDNFRETGIMSGKPMPHNHVNHGFPTDSGKVEIYSKKLKEWGYDPIPSIDVERVLSSRLDTNYPFILTSLKRSYFRHSGGKNIDALRKKYPEPLVLIHPNVAKSLGIKEGSYVYVETNLGRIIQKVRIEPHMHENTVYVDYGWYFPEKNAGELFGWDKANINILIGDDPPYGEEFGTPNLRAIPCKITPILDL
ncbi:MAG: molybdopterin-dependent oxidoreductase [Deltaproteobacteria bacterium]|nr:molybdopterin-dependent oxidoreductase [Deltaproteobacteria bacterium]